jgi:hypothetical protein
MAEDTAPRPKRFQLEEGDIEWVTGPFDVPQEAQDELAAREAALVREGKKVILREKLAAEQKRRAKG